MSRLSEKLTENLATNNEEHGNLCKNIDSFYIKIMNKLYRDLQLLTCCSISSNSLYKETLNPIYLHASNNSDIFLILKVNRKVKQCSSKRILTKRNVCLGYFQQGYHLWITSDSILYCYFLYSTQILLHIETCISNVHICNLFSMSCPLTRFSDAVIRFEGSYTFPHIFIFNVCHFAILHSGKYFILLLDIEFICLVFRLLLKGKLVSLPL